MYNNYNFKNYASFHRYSKHISRKITTDYTKQKIAESSNMNDIYQNRSKKQLPKERILTIPLLLESPKSKDFQSPDLEVDHGAEPNIIKMPTWNESQTLHPKLSLSKTSRKLATAQGSCLTNYGKINYSLSQFEQWNKINF